jgi:hypothetical protein
LPARGWYVLSGYAAQRTNDITGGLAPDQSSPQSRNLDVAALYFLSPVANGGYGGYLPSDSFPNEWLTGTANKMLVGYPVDGSQFGFTNIVPGAMYETGPQHTPLSLATDPVNDQQVYTASWLLSYPGNSGGPFYVQFNGYYYPAGVYLGTLYNGIVPYASAVRAIDSNVVNVIALAEALGDNGTNNSGGGVITVIPSENIANNPGVLEVTISPPAAFQAGGAWKLSTGTDYSTANPSAFSVTSSAQVQLQFQQIAGWNLPANASVSVAAGSGVDLTALYGLSLSWPTPASITYGTALGSSQLDATAIASGNYSYSPPAGTVLSAGAQNLSVTFSPSDTTDYGSASSTNTSLVVSAAPLVVTASNVTWTIGQVFPGFTGAIAGLVNGDSNYITVNYSANTNGGPGTYPIVPILADSGNRLGNYTVTTNAGVLTVIQAGQLVQNGGFETGNFSSWTLSGNAVDTGGSANIFVNSAFVHSGQFGAELGSASSRGYISQSLQSTAGQLYLLSLWLDSPDGEAPNEFSVAWNGVTLFDQVNLGAIGWTNLQFGVTATTTNTVLQIGFRDDPSNLGLDDVSVLPLAKPALQSVTRAGSTITFTWNAIPNEMYQIQTTTNLSQTNWSPAGKNVNATNSTMATSETISNGSPQFYRVVFLP